MFHHRIRVASQTSHRTSHDVAFLPWRGVPVGQQSAPECGFFTPADVRRAFPVPASWKCFLAHFAGCAALLAASGPVALDERDDNDDDNGGGGGDDASPAGAAVEMTIVEGTNRPGGEAKRGEPPSPTLSPRLRRRRSRSEVKADADAEGRAFARIADARIDYDAFDAAVEVRSRGGVMVRSCGEVVSRGSTTSTRIRRDRRGASSSSRRRVVVCVA